MVFAFNFVKIWIFAHSLQYEQVEHMLRNDDMKSDDMMCVQLTQCCVSSPCRHGLHQWGGETEGGADVGVPHRRVQTGCSQHSCKYQHTAVTSSLWHHHCGRSSHGSMCECVQVQLIQQLIRLSCPVMRCQCWLCVSSRFVIEVLRRISVHLHA